MATRGHCNLWRMDPEAAEVAGGVEGGTAEPWGALNEGERRAWQVRADAAVAALKPYFRPWAVGLAYAGSHSARVSLWDEGITKDLDVLIHLPDVEDEGHD